MKVLNNFFVRLLLVVAAVGMMPSCSCDSQKGLADKIDEVVSDNTDLVITGDIARCFNQLEIAVENGKVVLPDYITQLMNQTMNSKERIGFTEFLDKFEGLDYDNTLLAFNFNGMAPQAIFVFGVTDEDTFANSLKALEDGIKTGKAGSYTTVGGEAIQILMSGKTAYFTVDMTGPLTGDSAVKAIEGWQKKASEKPLASWKKDFLTRPNIVNGLLSAKPFYQIIKLASGNDPMVNMKKMGMEALADGFIGFSANLEGPTFEIAGVSMDKDGKPVAANIGGKFNESMMDYAAYTDMVAFSLCLNENGYKNLAEQTKSIAGNELAGLPAGMQSGMLDIIGKITELPAEYLSDGGIFASGGIASGVTMADFNPDSPKCYHVVVAADIKPEKAREAYSSICELLDNMAGKAGTNSGDEYTVAVKVNVGDDDVTDQPVYVEVPVYVKLEGNVVIVSNAPIVKAQYIPFDKTLFASSQVMIQAVITKATPVVKDLELPVGVNVFSMGSGADGKFIATFTDTEKKFFPVLVDLLSSIK